MNIDMAKNIEDLSKFFPGEINSEGILESVCSFSFKEIESKFLLQIRDAGKKFQFRIVYIAFGNQDFQEKKAVFYDLLKTLLFLFSA